MMEKFRRKSPENDPSQARILNYFTPEEQLILNNKLKNLSVSALMIGGDSNTKIIFGEPGDSPHFDFVHNIIRLDPLELLNKSEGDHRFTVAHEGGHRKISRFKHIPIDLWTQTGFSFLTNTIEDPRVNNYLLSAYEHLASDAVETYDPSYRGRVEKYLEESRNQLSESAEDILGHTPRFMQAGYEYLYQWYREVLVDGKQEITEGLPKDVETVVRKTMESARNSWLYYPNFLEANNEEYVSAYAERSFEVNRDEVWPLFQTLVEADIEEQKEQQVLQDMLKNKNQSADQGDSGDGGDKNTSDQKGDGGGSDEVKHRGHGFSIPNDLETKLNPDELKELQDALGEAMGQEDEVDNKESDGFEGENDSKDQTSSSDLSNTIPEQKPIQKPNVGDNKTTNDSNGNQPFSEETEFEISDAESNRAVKLSDLSPGLRKKLREFIDSLTETEKEKLRASAEEAIQRFEGELVEEMGAKFVDFPDESQENDENVSNMDVDDSAEGEHEENISFSLPIYRPLASKPVEENRNEPMHQVELKPAELTDAEQVQLAALQILMEQEMLKDSNSYEKYRREVIKIIKDLENDLREIFLARRKKSRLSGFRTGKKINIRKRIKEKGRGVPAPQTKAFERSENPSEKDYAISIVVDLSSSMAGEKIIETFKALIVLAEVLNKLSIRLEITGFNTQLFDFQKFGEKMGPEIRDRMSSIIILPSSVTDMGWAVEEASKRLAKEKAKEKFLIVMSDGQPYESDLHPRSIYELGSVIFQVISNTDQKLVGLGIGPDTGFMEDYFPNSLSNVTVEEMAETLAALILQVIENYGNFAN